MRARTLGIVAGAALLSAACSDTTPTSPPVDRLLDPQASAALGQSALAWGHGQATLSVGPHDVSFLAVKGPFGRATGWFRHFVSTASGTVDFTGIVTCMSVDAGLGRAWIAGKVLQNKSTRPDFMTAIHEPGDDIWFRVLDGGWRPSDPPDRTTIPGFEGGAGIITSQQYCDQRPWSADPTGVLSSGRIDVR